MTRLKIIWPDAMAPWQVVVCVINPKGDAAVADAAASLLQELRDSRPGRRA